MIKIFKHLTKKEWGLILCIAALTCFQVYLDLTLPDYMSEITLLLNTDGSTMSQIWSAGGKMLLCAFGSLISAIFVAILAAKIASNFSYNTRSKVFNQVMNFGAEEVNKFSISSLITRTTNDITQMQLLIVMGAQMLIKAPITAVWAIIKIANKNFTWTTATIIAVTVLVLVLSIVLSLAVPKFKKIQSLTDDLNKVSKEHLDGLPVVRAYNAEDYQAEKFEKVNDKVKNTTLFTNRAMSFLMPTMQAVSSGLVLSIYLIGAVLINNAVGADKLALFSDMVVFSSYAMQVVMAFMMLVMVFMLLPRATVASKRVDELLTTHSSLIYGAETDENKNEAGKIEFRNVSFKYPEADDYVVKDVSFVAKPGEVVALIGATGCGKSTIINLIPRFYDATEGDVLVGGINVKEYTKESLNSMIGYVSQKSTIFTGSIRSNMIFGDNAIIENGDIDKAANTAQVQDFVQNQEEKYDHFVAQGGGNLSGGQKQRLSIARAIYRDPSVFIFDDSFSALDYKTDRVLRDALEKECAGTTRIIVGQRIGTIRDADKILVIEDGAICGSGTHSELMQNCKAYQEIALSQLSEEELK